MPPKKHPKNKTYNYPELLEKYFPGDTMDMDNDLGQDGVLTRDGLFDVLKSVRRQENTDDKAEPEKKQE